MARKKPRTMADGGGHVDQVVVDDPIIRVGARESLTIGELAARVVATESGTRVPEVREVDGARELVTIAPDDKVWSESWEDSRVVADAMTYFNGAIVRVQPPPDATDERVDAVQALLANAGAAIVRVAARRKPSVLPPAAREAVAHEGDRQVVEQLVAEAHVDDREALRKFCDAVMQRQGVR